MTHEMQELRGLMTRAREGSQAAGAHLRRLVAPQMVRIVRRTLRTGERLTPLDRRILVEAERARADEPRRYEHDANGLVLDVAARVCDSLVRGAPHSAEPTRCLTETVMT